MVSMINFKRRLARQPTSQTPPKWTRKALKRLSDIELVALAKDQNKAAFGELYERYVDKIYSYIYYRTGNHHDAEDLTERVFMRAMSHIETYTERGVPFQAWLYRIAHNLVANWHRDRGRRKIIPLDEFIATSMKSDAPDHQAEEKEERELLLKAIRSLPEERQLLLTLKFVEHRSNAEIGAMMNRTEGAIKSLYHRTLLALREDLQHTLMLYDDLPSNTEGERDSQLS
jgi:RNA polymerase sigma-70 factor, ECF subfamily